MANQTNLTAQTPIGGGDLSALRRSVRQNTPEGLKAAAQQFEALFMNMVLKSMRDATPKGGLFDSEQTKLYTSLLDQKMSENFAKRGVGLADALIRQLSNNNGQTVPLDKSGAAPQADGFSKALADVSMQQQNSLTGALSSLKSAQATYAENLTRLVAEDTPQQQALTDDLRAALVDSIRSKHALLSANRVTESATSSSRTQTSKPAHVKAFQEKLGAQAEEVSRATGIPAKFMLGQAALESGWGKRVMVAADGTSSHNLFGIKATKGWSGKTVETTTTEYVNGVAYRKKEKFRAYDSYADSFKDYAKLLQNSPRYQNVLANSKDAVSFAQGLQRAGYATDPQYAAKLTSIIQRSLSA